MTHFQTWHALTLLHLAAVASGLLLYVSLTHSGRQRRPPSAAVAWVLALIAFPYLALPVYLLLGTRKLAHTQHEAGRGGNDGPAATRGLDLPRAQHCSSARFHGSGVQALDELLVLLGGAVQRIDIEMFIFRDDAVGVQIIAALEAAVHRGVRVRVLLDGLGALIGHRRTARALHRAGVTLRWFSPLRLQLRPGHGNLRNHRKLVLVDGSAMWSGGRNFAAEYFLGARRAPPWKDLSFVLEGGIVTSAVHGFEADWAIATGERAPVEALPCMPVSAGAPAQLLPSGPDRRDDTAYALYLSAIHRADRRVWAATPYFVPDAALQQALLHAVRRGVEVRLLLPARSNHHMADIARERSLRELSRTGVDIRLLPTMLHAKLVLVDEVFASCGSINLDGRSLFLNYELNTLFFAREDIHTLEAWFDAQCAPASAYVVVTPGWFRDVGEGLVRGVGFQL